MRFPGLPKRTLLAGGSEAGGGGGGVRCPGLPKRMRRGGVWLPGGERRKNALSWPYQL